jgi:hypothetical protein
LDPRTDDHGGVEGISLEWAVAHSLWYAQKYDHPLHRSVYQLC